jgi:hypothetical protein
MDAVFVLLVIVLYVATLWIVHAVSRLGGVE